MLKKNRISLNEYNPRRDAINILLSDMESNLDIRGEVFSLQIYRGDTMFHCPGLGFILTFRDLEEAHVGLLNGKIKYETIKELDTLLKLQPNTPVPQIEIPAKMSESLHKKLFDCNVTSNTGTLYRFFKKLSDSANSDKPIYEGGKILKKILDFAEPNERQVRYKPEYVLLPPISLYATARSA